MHVQALDWTLTTRPEVTREGGMQTTTHSESKIQPINTSTLINQAVKCQPTCCMIACQIFFELTVATQFFCHAFKGIPSPPCTTSMGQFPMSKYISSFLFHLIVLLTSSCIFRIDSLSFSSSSMIKMISSVALDFRKLKVQMYCEIYICMVHIHSQQENKLNCIKAIS